MPFIKSDGSLKVSRSDNNLVSGRIPARTSTSKSNKVQVSRSDNMLNITRDTLLSISRDGNIDWKSARTIKLDESEKSEQPSGEGHVAVDIQDLKSNTKSGNTKYKRRISYSRKSSTGSSSLRYDLRDSRNPIKNINDLVDDDFDSLYDEDDDDSELASQDCVFCKYGPGCAGGYKWKFTTVILALIGVIAIAGASVAVVYAVNSSFNSNIMNTAPLNDDKAAPKELLGFAGHTNLKNYAQPVAYSVANMDIDLEMEDEQQELLELAEQVVMACIEEQLVLDVSLCDELCWDVHCCFESGSDSCLEEESTNCAVFSGCEALVW